MKKLLEKDKKIRFDLDQNEKNHLVLMSIFKNLNFKDLTRWNAFLKLKQIQNKNSKTSLSNRCLVSLNKKRFNKLTTFSRYIFLKLLRSGKVSGFRRSNW